MKQKDKIRGTKNYYGHQKEENPEEQAVRAQMHHATAALIVQLRAIVDYYAELFDEA